MSAALPASRRVRGEESAGYSMQPCSTPRRGGDRRWQHLEFKALLELTLASGCTHGVAAGRGDWMGLDWI